MKCQRLVCDAAWTSSSSFRPGLVCSLALQEISGLCNSLHEIWCRSSGTDSTRSIGYARAYSYSC